MEIKSTTLSYELYFFVLDIKGNCIMSFYLIMFHVKHFYNKQCRKV